MEENTKEKHIQIWIENGGLRFETPPMKFTELCGMLEQVKLTAYQQTLSEQKQKETK